MAQDSWFACDVSYIGQVSEYSGYNYMANLLNVKDSSPPANPRILCWILTSPGGTSISCFSVAWSG